MDKFNTSNYQVGDKVRVMWTDVVDVMCGVKKGMIGKVIEDSDKELPLVAFEESGTNYMSISQLELVVEDTINDVELSEINDSVDVIVDLYQRLSDAGMEDEYIVELIVNILN